MKFLGLFLSSILTSAAIAGVHEIDNDWTRIELKKPITIKNEKILNSVDIAVSRAVYWEDEGYEFKKTGPILNPRIQVLYKESGDVLALEVLAEAPVGGFGWYPGYRSGTASCHIFVFEGDEWDWSWDGRNASAECEIEYDLEE
ncbi:MAG: hypothetical protein AAF202_11115 [Pseudomonadota bacterium]